ncbi:hypothetical protein BH10BAC5_BH10BAC5_11210 [soil metagenome]
MNYLLFANPDSGAIIFKRFKRFFPKAVITKIPERDNLKRKLYRILTGKMTIEDRAKLKGIVSYDYKSLTTDSLKKIIHENKIEVGIITTFSWKIKKDFIEAFPKGIINFHPSLLPLHAGPNPFFWIIYDGDRKTATTCQMAGLEYDSGDILLQKEFEVGEMDSKELFLKFADDIAEIIPEVVSKFETYYNGRKKAGTPIHDPKDIVKESNDEQTRKRLERANAFYK